jgi:prepilin-type N-terminal cleavage/methylation domain-containing protein
MSHRTQPAQILRTARKASRGVYPRGPAPRSGLTLIEMLVALAVTLVMMAAVVNLFANISGSIRNRRAVIEVTGQLRQVRQQLALDLAGATCSGNTWQRPEYDPGYIEIIEGEWSDAYPSVLVDGDTDNGEIDYKTSLVPSGGDPTIDLSATNPQLTPRAPELGDVTNGRALGDWDDILALTVRSEAEPFRAMVGPTMVESVYAEVVWYAGENGVSAPAPEIPGMRRIYRRVLLIVPTLGPWPSRPENVSARFVPNGSGGGQWVANTLSDLTKRENRMCREHVVTEPNALFPHPFLPNLLQSATEYKLLDDALAFDIRVYDPGAPLFEAPGGRVVQPGDPGWIAEAIKPTPVIAGFGAYCDLGWAWDRDAKTTRYDAPMPLPAGVPAPIFNWLRSVGWHPTELVALRDYPCVYDTWSYHYENDGINQEQILIDWARAAGISPVPSFVGWQLNTLDQGTNGLDDDGANGVDDPGERETSPPYDVPLRGIKVSLRIYERDARQIRETSVTHAFTP